MHSLGRSGGDPEAAAQAVEFDVPILCLWRSRLDDIDVLKTNWQERGRWKEFRTRRGVGSKHVPQAQAQAQAQAGRCSLQPYAYGCLASLA
jgi:hypothetical protein